MDEMTRPDTAETMLPVAQDVSGADTPGPDHTTWRVPLVQIHPFERNPRLSPNPEYDRIKDSIRHQGLDQPLVITQRPGAGDYIVHSGGNTRLKVLKELFAESGDPRYAEVPCLFRPWRSESDVLLAHLRENDIRGSLSFIDKARVDDKASGLLTAEDYLGLHRETGLSLRAIWSQTQRWAQYGPLDEHRQQEVRRP